jgi:hypothetical protein
MSVTPSRVLFVTGRLAEPALRRVLESMAPPFACDVAVLKITVAALMTTPWIARHLEVPGGVDLVLLPGLCEGDLSVLRDKYGVEVGRGPKDLRELPRFFGRAATVEDYGAFDIEILAEINNAPRLQAHDVRKSAEYFRDSGADIIDIGCTPGLPYPALGEVVSGLVSMPRKYGPRLPPAPSWCSASMARTSTSSRISPVLARAWSHCRTPARRSKPSSRRSNDWPRTACRT